MAVAAVTPRVRTIVICDEAVAGPTESDVFTLEGVRVRLQAERFPWRAALSVYLLLSSARKGKFAGRILLINERNEKPIRYDKFLVTFEGDQEMMPLYVDMGQCVFAEPGPYRFEVHFSVRDGGEALKGEHPFHVLAPEE